VHGRGPAFSYRSMGRAAGRSGCCDPRLSDPSRGLSRRFMLMDEIKSNRSTSDPPFAPSNGVTLVSRVSVSINSRCSRALSSGGERDFDPFAVVVPEYRAQRRRRRATGASLLVAPTIPDLCRGNSSLYWGLRLANSYGFEGFDTLLAALPVGPASPTSTTGAPRCFKAKIEYRVDLLRDWLHLLRLCRQDHTPTPIDLFWRKGEGGEPL
jgi:hypothetical protein